MFERYLEIYLFIELTGRKWPLCGGQDSVISVKWNLSEAKVDF